MELQMLKCNMTLGGSNELLMQRPHTLDCFIRLPVQIQVPISGEKNLRKLFLLLHEIIRADEIIWHEQMSCFLLHLGFRKAQAVL